MTFLENLIATRDNLAAVYLAESARYLALTDAGKPIPVTYSIDGKSVQWTGSLDQLAAKIRELNDLIVQVSEPYEIHMRLYS